MTKQTLHRAGESRLTGLLLLACLLTGAMASFVLSLDPVKDGLCAPGLADLPFAADDPGNLASCMANGSFHAFVRWDFVLIVLYAVAEVAALWWIRKCLKSYSWPRWRLQLLTITGAVVIVAGAAADLFENFLLLFDPVNVVALVGVSWAKLILVGIGWALTLVALVIAVWRFVFPWTIPPDTSSLNILDVERGRAGKVQATSPSSQEPLGQPRYGIGLSGGGIRSAAFCSGALQVIGADSTGREPGWQLDEADYLATVSGGGYIGCSMQLLDRAAQLEHPDEVLSASNPSWYADQAPETGFLFTGDQAVQRHRYLGQGRSLLMRAGALLLSVAINILLAGLVLLVTGAAVAWLGDRLFQVVGDPKSVLAGPREWLLVVLAMAVIGGLIWQLNQAEHVESNRSETRAKVLRAVGAVMVLGAMVLAVTRVAYSPWAWLVVLGLAGSGGLVSRVKPPTLASSVSARLLFSGGWLVAAWMVMLAGAALITTPWVWVMAMAILVPFFLLMDQTWVSPHPFYKWRLASTFAVRRVRGADEPETENVEVLDFSTFTHLDEWAAPIETAAALDTTVRRRRPELLICAAAAIEDVSIKPQGTRAVPFVFRYDQVGSPELGELSVSEFRRALGRNLASDGTMQAAMAISAAAVASNIGVQGRIPTVGTALALLNLRLGVWLPNPRFKGSRSGGPFSHRRAGIWFLRELTGVLPANRRYVYVSDGGHLDNLGLLELLRRRCRTILLIDASGDPLRTTAAFDSSLEIAKDLFHVEFLGRESNIAAPAIGEHTNVLPTGASKDCIDIIRLRYPAERGLPQGEATVILAKAVFSSALVGNEDQQNAISLQSNVAERQRWHQWRGRAGSVPKTSTLRQSLTDDAYTAYVRLGRAVGYRARDILRREALSATGDRVSPS